MSDASFSFPRPVAIQKVKEQRLSYYLSIAGGRIDRFMISPMILALCEMQTASFKI